MTIGDQTSDNRRTAGLVSGFQGSYFRKIWNGTDQAPRVKRAPRKFRTIERYEVIGGKRTLMFRQRIPIYTDPPKRARLGEHPYSMTLDQQRDEAVQSLSVGTWYGAMVMAGNSNVPDWNNYTSVELFGANDRIALVNKLREKLQGSDFNMSVFLGEGHQTLKMIGDTAFTLAKSIRALKKGNLKGAADALGVKTSRYVNTQRALDSTSSRLSRGVAALGVKTPKGSSARRVAVDNVSSRWLELQYGWKPLLSDVKGAAEMLAHHLNTPFSTTYRVAKRRELVQNCKALSTGPIQWTGVSRKVHRMSLIARIKEAPTVPQMLGLMDPELVAWELLPFSFVADWFGPIGDWLQARALANKLTGTFITTEYRYGESANLAFSSGVSPGGRKSTRYARVAVSRSISTTLSVPKPQFKGLEKALSVQHCLNGIALLNQVAKGRSVR